MRKILIPLIVLIIIGTALSLEYKCSTEDGKTWLCDIPIEKFFEDTNANIDEVSTFTDSSTGTTIKVYGTDYFTTETNATTFLQLLNSTNEPVSNSSCFVSIWNPDKTAFLLNGSMSYHTEGLFYYDYNLPSSEGIYMMSAKCVLPKLNVSSYYTSLAYDEFEYGTWSDGNGWTDDWLHYGDFADISTAQSYSNPYSALLRRAGVMLRGFDLTDYKNFTITAKIYLQSIDLNEFARIEFNDGVKETIRLYNSTDDTAVWENFTYTFADGTFTPTCNAQLIFSIEGSSTDDFFYIDNINITGWKYNYTEVSGYEYQEIRGSGEIHVINAFNMSFYPSKTRNYYNQTCLDNSTLQMNYTTEYCYGSSCHNYTTTESKSCLCGNNKCESSYNWLVVAGFGALIIFISWLLLRKRFLNY